LLYGNARATSFQKLPVALVRLTVGEKTQTVAAAAGSKAVSFDIQLTTDGNYPVKAELLDSAGQVITGGYFVYCRKTTKVL
jgi:hypothetical protein